MPTPLTAAALPAIAPQLASQGLDLLSGVFRSALNKGPEEVAALIREQTGIDINDAADNKFSAAQWAQLKQFEFEQQARLLDLRQRADASTLALADRSSARDLQRAAITSDDLFVRRFIYYYAAALTLLTFAFIFYAAFFHRDVPSTDPSWRIIDTVMGFLLGVTLSAIIQFFFGSSQGSRNKDKRIQELTEAIANAEAGDDRRGERS